jgi:hypothetical protein
MKLSGHALSVVISGSVKTSQAICDLTQIRATRRRVPPRGGASGAYSGITSIRAEDGRHRGHSARRFARCYLGIYDAVESYSDGSMRKVYPVPDVPWSNVTNALQRF